jgi:subtilisin-like proprotein convertase family protein
VVRRLASLETGREGKDLMRARRSPDGGPRRYVRWFTAAALLLAAVALPVSPAEATVFSNTDGITMPDSGGLFQPYPSTIAVSGVSAPITHVTVTLHGLTHGQPADLAILLVGPNPADYTVLMTGSGGVLQGTTNTDLTFDDAATQSLPGGLHQAIVSGTYKPTNNSSYYLDTSLTNTQLSVFNGKSANGNWLIYGGDLESGSGLSGSISSWSINITTAPGLTSFTPDEGIVGDTVTMTGTNLDTATAVRFGATPAATFTVQSPTQISAMVPAGAGTGLISIVTPGGTLTSATDFVVDHTRDVSLRLIRGKAKGNVGVDDGFAPCLTGVPVKIQRRHHGRWQIVAATLTNAQGGFFAPGASKPGKYRAVAKLTTLSSGDVCEQATSPRAVP